MGYGALCLGYSAKKDTQTIDFDVALHASHRSVQVVYSPDIAQGLRAMNTQRYFFWNYLPQM